MEARATDKKLTRAERLKNCGVSDDLIPKKYFDEGLSYDVLDVPIEVDGKIVELSFIEKWQRQQMTTAMAKCPPTTAEELRIICLTNPLTRVPYKTYTFRKDLDEEIEAWVFAREMEYLGRIKNEKNEYALQLTEENLKIANERLTFLLEYENVSPPYEKENETKMLLERIDMLTRAKMKLKYGEQYYDMPDILSNEIKRLLKKQETGDFSQEDEKELALCLEKKDKPNRAVIMRQQQSRQLMPMMMRHFHLGLFQPFEPAINSSTTDSSIVLLPKLGRPEGEDA